MNLPSDISKVIPPLNNGDRILGSPNATIVLMKYGDYQCPQSAQAHFTVKVLQQRLGDQLCFVFRHFPQKQIHPQAQRAAESAEAAGVQGKFWQMHDTLFTHQQTLADSDLVEYAAGLELDIPRFLQELSGRVHAERVQSDINSGRKHGVEETPTFFIGICHKGTQNLEILLMSIQEMTTVK